MAFNPNPQSLRGLEILKQSKLASGVQLNTKLVPRQLPVLDLRGPCLFKSVLPPTSGAAFEGQATASPGTTAGGARVGLLHGGALPLAVVGTHPTSPGDEPIGSPSLVLHDHSTSASHTLVRSGSIGVQSLARDRSMQVLASALP